MGFVHRAVCRLALACARADVQRLQQMLDAMEREVCRHRVTPKRRCAPRRHQPAHSHLHCPFPLAPPIPTKCASVPTVKTSIRVRTRTARWKCVCYHVTSTLTAIIGTLTAIIGTLTAIIGTLTAIIGTLTAIIRTLTAIIGTLTAIIGTLTAIIHAHHSVDLRLVSDGLC